MSDTFLFIVQEGVHSQAQALYLPYGTRTLKLEVINQAGRPLKLWLRPESTPEEFPEHVIHGYGDDDLELWVHWGGGEESGATVKMKDVLYKAVPAEVPDDGTPHPVFLNLTHPSGAIRPRTVTLRAYTGEKAADVPLESTLKVSLAVPTTNAASIESPVAGVWNEAKTQLKFVGDTIPDYVSRWWASAMFVYRPAGDLPGRLRLDRKDDTLTLKLDADSGDNDGVCLAEIMDNGWSPGQDTQGLRHVLGELYHFLESRYYVVRLWFLWLDKRIGPAHEVPDAERVEVLFDVETGRSVFLGTDFHYREVWTQLQRETTCPRVMLSVHRRNLDDLLRLLLLTLAGGRYKGDPAQEVHKRIQGAKLPGMTPLQKGPITGTPLQDLKGLILPDAIISEDVRKG
jgi:hypothetical protein